MNQLIEKSLGEKSQGSSSSISVLEGTRSRRGKSDGNGNGRRHPPNFSEESSTRVVVIGAGPTGLSAAYHLGTDALLLERESTVGGWCRSIVDKGFTFDFAGHIMFRMILTCTKCTNYSWEKTCTGRIGGVDL